MAQKDALNDKRLDDILPIPLNYFPNQMGINLVSVSSISWTTLPDNQIIDINIGLIPAKK